MPTLIRSQMQQDIHRVFGRALCIRHVDAGSCNGCELEIHALGNPYYNLEGLGIKFVASPRHADALLVTGPVSRNMAEALKRTYDATPDPKWVIAVGDCAALRRGVRRELCKPGQDRQRDSGGCDGAGLSAIADGFVAGDFEGGAAGAGLIAFRPEADCWAKARRSNRRHVQ